MFIPIAVGDITIFIPIMASSSSGSVTGTSTDGRYDLSWSAVSNASYYQIIITDESGTQRIIKVIGTHYSLAGLSLGSNKIEIQACNASNQCGVSYLAGTVSRSSRVRYQHTDMLGTPVMETDESGNVISRSVYEPFGKRLGGEKAGIGFTGHLQDEDLGLTYMQARYYDPLIGRFYSNDPVDVMKHIARGNSLHGFNRYIYANNNPYKYTDSDGEFATVPLAVFGAIVGGVGGGISAFANGGDFGDAVTAAGIGATFGGLAGLSGGTSLLSTAVVGGIASGAGELTGQVVASVNVDTSSIESTLTSAVASVADGLENADYSKVSLTMATGALGGVVDKTAKAIGFTAKSAAVIAETTNIATSAHVEKMAHDIKNK